MAEAFVAAPCLRDQLIELGDFVFTRVEIGFAGRKQVGCFSGPEIGREIIEITEEANARKPMATDVGRTPD